MNLRRSSLLLLALSLTSAANVLTLNPSTQNVTMTGTGANSSGLGTARFSWGSCSYDGTNTTCIVSGTYTGLGNGGTYQFTLQYPGNGPSPLTAVQQAPGSNNVYFNLTSGTFTFTITPTGGSTTQFYDLNFNLQYTSSATCVNVPGACAVGAMSLTNGGTITGPETGSFDATPVITTPGGLISASAYGSLPAICPATWIEIYGLNLATTPSYTWSGSDFNGVNAPTTLSGTTVTVGGKPAYIDFVSPHQVNAQVPSGIGTGVQTVVVTTAGGSSVAYSVVVNAVEPGLLAPSAFKLAAGQYVVALKPDNVTYVLPPGSYPVPTAVARPGDILTLYGVGFGPVTPVINAGVIVQQANSLSGFSATIGGQPATVQFAGLVAGYLGLYQFNLVVPNVPANNATPLTFSIGGVSGTQQLLLAVGN